MNQMHLLSDIDKKSSLSEIQNYIKKVGELRGFSNHTVQETMLLLLEETGELAKAIRKNTSTMSVDIEKLQNYDTVESEVADIFFVLVTVCNQLNINLLEALQNKEQLNCRRNWVKLT